MFTGLIQQIGKLAAKEMNGDSLRIGIIINAQKWNPPLMEGESISVNGVCLTAAEITDKGFACDVLKETINCSNLGTKPIGTALNLERAIRAGEPLGGHLIAGHVEGLGTLIRRMNIGRDWKLDFFCDKALLCQMVSKGSITCDGASLTITSLEKTSFSVNIIPFTWANTNLHQLREGDTVNLETDLIGKYVFRWLEENQKAEEKPTRSITEDIFRKAGFMDET